MWASTTCSRRSSPPSSCRPAPLRDVFLGAHADLLTVEYWRGMQQRQREGEVVDVFPYSAARRLVRT